MTALVEISAWCSLILALPVLWLGQAVVRRVPVLRRYNIPHPVVGGLLIAMLVLALSFSGQGLSFHSSVSSRWWTWLVTTEPEWASSPAKSVHLPLLVAFFTCIGLNASWTLMKRAGPQAVLFLGITIGLTIFQNVIGVGMARLLGASDLLGLVCGSVTQIGGIGTAMGFAGDFEKAGLKGAAALGAAAATFGMVAGCLVGGPVGSGLVRRRRLEPSAGPGVHLESGDTAESNVLKDIKAVAGFGWRGLTHLLLVLACVKAGAWVSYFIQKTGITFPVYMGALITGVVARNVADVALPKIRTEVVDTIGSVMLALFLAVTMMSLNLSVLADTALPMIIILLTQAMFIALFARFITFRLMGSDYDAAVMAAGQCGFGLGATSNAVATMKSIVESFGPSPKAFLLVPVVGSFLIDLFNAVNVTVFLNLLGNQ